MGLSPFSIEGSERAALHLSVQWADGIFHPWDVPLFQASRPVPAFRFGVAAASCTKTGRMGTKAGRYWCDVLHTARKTKQKWWGTVNFTWVTSNR